jgi:thiosulfate dehydrogenase [quinone] large subunit
VRLKALVSKPGGSVLVLRAFLGVTFTYAGFEKLANRGFFDAHSLGSIQSQIEGSIRTTPVGSLLGPLIHAAVPIGLVIAFGEIAVGLGTLLGLYARAAAIGGTLLALTFFLTVSFNDSPYYYGPDIVFLFAWSPIVIGGPGPLSLDSYFAGRRSLERLGAGQRAPGTAALDRRVMVGKLATGGLVAGFAVVAAGLVAALGRMLGKGTTTDTVSLGGGSVSTGPSGGSGSAPTMTSTPGAKGTPPPKGRLLGKASDVPVGGAASFSDPYESSAPGYVVQPKRGEFVAFSAICTHEGCTVQYVRSEQQFHCPCHGSVFSALTGDVVSGPAPSPLERIRVAESGGEIYVED